MRRIAFLAATTALLAACAQEKAAPAESTEVPIEGANAAPAVEVTGFSHPAGADLFGYYMPATEVKAGDHRLDHFHIGDEQAFAEWEGGQRDGPYGPVMFEFDDVTSPKATNELGGEVHTVRERAVADAYSIAPDGEIRFVDNHPKLGKVTFSGRLDMSALAANKAPTGPSGPVQTTVLTGTLTVGDQTFRDVQFTWFGGD